MHLILPLKEVIQAGSLSITIVIKTHIKIGDTLEAGVEVMDTETNTRIWTEIKEADMITTEVEEDTIEISITEGLLDQVVLQILQKIIKGSIRIRLVSI